MHVALFGGAFNPPHLGHVLAACYARSVAPIDVLWVLPAIRHPYGKALAPFADRLALCRAAFAPLGPWCAVRTDEDANPNGYTIDLVEALARRHPGHRWSLVGGTDTAADLPRWHRGTELQRLVDVIAVPRLGYDDHPAALPRISSSLVRERIARDGDSGGLLPAAVEQRIREQGWYR